MIRYIASDMDGTLLKNGAQSLSPDFFPVLEKLLDRGILFIAASGRQYANLRALLGPYADRCDYLCENGAFAVHRGTIIYKSILDRTLGRELMADIIRTPGCEVQLSGIDTAYICAKDPAFTHHVKYVVKNHITEVPDLFQTTEDYIKISTYVHDGAQTVSRMKEFEARWGDKFKLVTTCDHWIDFIPPNVHKGTAMKALMKVLDAEASELMAFGDNYNDLELLACAEESYAVSDGKPEVIRACRHTCDRVEDALIEFIKTLP